ncbi:hypothetical protein CMK14_09495 [Candidatus Poribacteria bacterium]|nr:hypothetical protein [Candidatus Poribacteria bacterium]
MGLDMKQMWNIDVFRSSFTLNWILINSQNQLIYSVYRIAFWLRDFFLGFIKLRFGKITSLVSAIPSPLRERCAFACRSQGPI